MELFTPAWQGDDEKKALAWIEKCDNQKKLTAAAMEAPTVARRTAAVKKLTDPETLARALKGGPAFYNDYKLKPGQIKEARKYGQYVNLPCQEAALERIRDPELLYRVAQEKIWGLETWTNWAASAVVRKLRDAGYDIEAMAADTKLPWDTRVAAIGLVDSQDFLIRLADSENRVEKGRVSVRLHTIRRITDPEARKRFCATDETHEWKPADYDVKEIGDTRFITSVSRCIYCGKEKTEHESYKF